MRVLVFGGAGMLGHQVVRSWSGLFEVFATIRGRFEDYSEFAYLDRSRTIDAFDIESTERVGELIAELRPDVIFNAVGIIKQLPTSKNTITTLSVNSIFPHRLAEMAAAFGSRLIAISTDCVFDGKRGMYTESDEPNATDLYGISKRLGEVTGANCLTIRTSIIGPELKTRHSLLEWFLSNSGGRVNGFRKAIYSGFPTVVLADILADIIVNRREMTGLYHLSSEPIDKFELLKLFREAYDIEVGIEPVEDFVIDRSLDSARFRAETGFVPEDWPSMVERMAAADPMHRQIGRKRK